MKTITELKTYLPCFSGFYQSLDCVDDVESLESAIFNNASSVDSDILDHVINEACDCIDYSKLKADISRHFCDCVETKLKELGVLDAINFESIWSPREYNFQNDSINVDMKNVNLTKLFKMVNNFKEEYKTWLSDHYQSRSGFISFYDHEYLDVLETVFQTEDNDKRQNYISNAMEFILSLEFYSDTENFEYQLWDSVYEIFSIAGYIDYGKLTDSVNKYFKGNEINYFIKDLAELENLNIEDYKAIPSEYYYCRDPRQLSLVL